MRRSSIPFIALLAQLLVALSPLELVLCLHAGGTAELELGRQDCCDEPAEPEGCGETDLVPGGHCEDVELAVRLPQGRGGAGVPGERPRGGEVPAVEVSTATSSLAGAGGGDFMGEEGEAERAFPLGQRELRLRV